MGSAGDIPRAKASRDEPRRLPTVSRALRLTMVPVFGNRGLFFRYAVALLAVVTIAGMRVAAEPWAGDRARLLPFAFAIVATAFLSGSGPALFATILAPLLATLLFSRLAVN